MNIVISQPMYFPWYGMFEQIRLSNLFVYYDDVPFSKGSFTNRVQIKTNTEEGFKWMTIPLSHFKLGTHINDIKISNKNNWKKEHILLLKNNYQNAPFYKEMNEIVEALFEFNTDNLSELTIQSMQLILTYFAIDKNIQIERSSQLNISGKSSQRVFDIVSFFKADTYITGHGAKKYLDHTLFEKNNIDVEYINYKRNVYPQLFGPFNPHVSILDLIANTGKEGIKYLNSTTQNWKVFLHAEK